MRDPSNRTGLRSQESQTVLEYDPYWPAAVEQLLPLPLTMGAALSFRSFPFFKTVSLFGSPTTEY
jgi:hypothetical protein